MKMIVISSLINSRANQIELIIKQQYVNLSILCIIIHKSSS